MSCQPCGPSGTSSGSSESWLQDRLATFQVRAMRGSAKTLATYCWHLNAIPALSRNFPKYHFKSPMVAWLYCMSHSIHRTYEMSTPSPLSSTSTNFAKSRIRMASTGSLGSPACPSSLYTHSPNVRRTNIARGPSQYTFT